MNAPLGVLRFPRTPAMGKGRDVVTTPDGSVVMVCDASNRGRQVDCTAADGTPLGRIVEVRGGRWQLIAPGSGAVLASAETRWGVRIAIGAGPTVEVKGRGEEWDVAWGRTPLLAARTVPRKIAKHVLDVWVTDPACTPVVVAFVVHVRRWWQAAETTNQLLVQQLATPPPAAPT